MTSYFLSVYNPRYLDLSDSWEVTENVSFTIYMHTITDSSRTRFI